MKNLSEIGQLETAHEISEPESNLEEDDSEEFKWQELLLFEKGFWLMACDCLLTFSIIETTVAIGTDIMGKLYQWPDETTGMFVTVPYLVCGISLIPLGHFVDKNGKR